MINENLSYRQKIIDWILNNEATIKDICEKYLDRKAIVYNLYSVEYHEDIHHQYKDRVVSDVCDTVCKDLGCSAEQFYETIEGTEQSWILLSKD